MAPLLASSMAVNCRRITPLRCRLFAPLLRNVYTSRLSTLGLASSILFLHPRRSFATTSNGTAFSSACSPSSPPAADTSSSAVGRALTGAELRTARDGDLHTLLLSKQQELAALSEVKTRCELTANRYPDRVLRFIFALLVLQAAVLFDWVYVHFDWNLVEPITYLIGYSATWLAIIWYGALQREFTYDGLRELLLEQELAKQYAAEKFDLARYERLSMDVVQLERIMRSLEGI